MHEELKNKLMSRAVEVLTENLREPVPRFRIDKLVDSPAATHLRYMRE